MNGRVTITLVEATVPIVSIKVLQFYNILYLSEFLNNVMILSERVNLHV